MPPDQRDAALLADMLGSARIVASYVAGRQYGDYLADQMLRDAVERRVEIVGEAARGVSRAFQDAHPESPGGRSWRSVASWRTSTRRCAMT